MKATSDDRASHTLSEILSQPQCWTECLGQLAGSRDLMAAVEIARPGAEWVFVGCGSSYYLAMAAADTFMHLGLPARAIPASEVVLYPQLSLPGNNEYCPVLISRSGLTSEVLRAARLLQQERKLPTIAITCTETSPLEALSTTTLKLLASDEQSTVMTRSFTSMLLGLQYLGATVSGREDFRNRLVDLPAQVKVLIDSLPGRLQEFVEKRTFGDYIFLAQGPLFGVANEAMLKVMESSCSYAQVFHALEFRHGPKAIASPQTLMTFFLSESSYEHELEVLEEMKQLGASTLVVGNELDMRARNSGDFCIELGLQAPEYARLAAFTIWGQLLGVYTGIQKGLNPDAPKNLSRVVVLDGHH